MAVPPYIQERDGTIRPGKDIAPSELPPLEVDERTLTFIRIDYQTRLQFGHTEIIIETPFVLLVDGVEHALDPEQRAGLGPLLAIYPDELQELSVSDGGELRVAFESGAVVTVPTHPRYEAWHVAGPGTRLVVCGHGGRLSVWT